MIYIVKDIVIIIKTNMSTGKNLTTLNSYSQLNQDVNVLDFFSNKSGLYFVDIGANDGKTLSNTFLLEHKYKWDGICSEPLPEAYEKLTKCRNVIYDSHAVFNESGLQLDFSKSDLLSGITNCIDKHTHAKMGSKIKVNTITLQDLLDNYQAPSTIHYLSLDTEGSELHILQSVDFTKYKFLYMNLEHNYIEPRRTNIRKLLLDNGYLYKGENKWDDDYVHESTLVGTYYFNQDYTKPIVIKRDGPKLFTVSSPYWNSDTGVYEDGVIKWSLRGTGKLFFSHIDYGYGNIWHRDERK